MLSPRSRWFAVRVALCATLLLPSVTQAQFCFRGQPRPHCGGFTILEFAAGTRLKTSVAHSGYDEANRFYLSWSGGYLHNLGVRSSLGAAFKVAADDDGDRYGPVLRYRQWLGNTWSLDLGPGLIMGGTDNVPGRLFPSLMLDLAINWGDRIALDAGLERVRREGALASSWDCHVGLRFETWLAPLATLGLGILAGATYN